MPDKHALVGNSGFSMLGVSRIRFFPVLRNGRYKQDSTVKIVSRVVGEEIHPDAPVVKPAGVAMIELRPITLD